MFRLYDSHPPGNVEHCLGTQSAHSVESHFVYILVINIHEIEHYIVKLSLEC
jgi:hypothetical protein